MALIVRPLFLVLVALSLVSGIAGGLLRLGLAVPATAEATWLGYAAASHAALMISGFLGTVIGIERALAIKRRAAFLAPLASALGGLCLLTGRKAPAAELMVVAAALFVAVNVVVVRRQMAAHTLLLLIAAMAWLFGSVLFAAGAGAAALLPWWFGFLVLTIAAERLEMTRLMRRRPAARLLLYLVLAAMLVGAVVSAFSPTVGGSVYGASMVLLAAWLGVFDIARRTMFAQGLSRYMAICLLGGYIWLAVAGVAWAGAAWGLPWRDAALHALGLGFVFCMVMGHAPVILPAVAGVKLQFGAFFYAPLVLMHVSLALRLGWGGFDTAARAYGAMLNAAAVALFAATVAGAAVTWHLNHGARSAREGN